MLPSVADLLNDYIDQEKLWNQEGERGIQNLENIVNVLGYANLDEFLSDNPGAIEAILEWIGTQNVTDWKKKLTEAVDEEEQEQEEEVEE